MMSLGLSTRDRRTLIVGATAIGMLFALGRGVPMMMQWQSTQIAEASTVASDVAQSRAGSRLLPQLRDTLRTYVARLNTLDSAMLSGPTPSAAAARLASEMEILADESSVKIGAMQLQADSADVGALVLVGVRVTAVADVFGLLAFMRAIEGGERLLAVRELVVTQPEPDAPASKAESLRVELTVVALARVALEKD
jgi:hypothetical protein